LFPQHFAWFEASHAHEWLSPVAMPVTPVSPATYVGFLAIAVVPLPSWPSWL